MVTTNFLLQRAPRHNENESENFVCRYISNRTTANVCFIQSVADAFSLSHFRCDTKIDENSTTDIQPEKIRMDMEEQRVCV